MSGWGILTVSLVALVFVTLPLLMARASRSGRLDPALERAGRPLRRAVDWLGMHYRVRLTIVVLLAAGYAVTAGLMFVDGYHLMGVLGILSGLAACTSLATQGMSWRQEHEAWRKSHREPPRP